MEGSLIDIQLVLGELFKDADNMADLLEGKV